MNDVTANFLPVSAALFLQTICIYSYSWSAGDNQRLTLGICLVTCFGLIPGLLFAAYALYHGTVIGPLREALVFTFAGVLLPSGAGELVRRLRAEKEYA